jgi:hypothetical protein
MIVAPITEKNNAGSQMGHVRAWLPQGIWTDFFTGRVYDGLKGRMLDLYRNDYSIPVLCKAGAIVPLQAHVAHDNRLGGAEKLEILAFPGADNEFTLYEDAGDGNGYRSGESVTTTMKLTYTDQKALFEINPAEGDCSLIPSVRKYAVCLRGFAEPDSVTVEGKSVDFSFDPTTHTVRIELETPVTQKVTVCVTGADLRNRNTDVLDQAVEILKRSQTGMEFKNALYKKMLECNPITEYELYITSRSPEERATVAAVLELYLLERECLR